MPTFRPLAALVELLAPDVLSVLLPHPASAIATSEATATIFIDVLKALSLGICTTSAKCTERRTFCDSTRHPATLRVGLSGSPERLFSTPEGTSSHGVIRGGVPLRRPAEA